LGDAPKIILGEIMHTAFIAGCAGHELSSDEFSFFRDRRPAGFILFERNCATPDQLKTLIGRVREALHGDSIFVAIDQEGGRVQRLVPPHWRQYPAAMDLAKIADIDPVEGERALHLVNRAIAKDLIDLGINMNCTPVLDLPVEGAHDIIGNRALGHDVETISKRARIVADAHLECGVLPVIKHVPGHGRSLNDSHKALPIVNASREELEQSDFETFKRLNDMPVAMTAHIVYSDIDDTAPASTSPVVIKEIIREHIGFDGLLMSDDLSMQALEGSMTTRTRGVLLAGCDLALHCNGDLKEMVDVAESSPELTGEGLVRFKNALARLDVAPHLPLVHEAEKLEQLLAGIG